jgi:hypothetical protein
MLEQRRYDFILLAVTPIAHHAESFGNAAVIMRRKVRLPNMWADVPIVTADTMRHGLREAGANVLLDAAGLLDVHTLTEAALRLLFSGGNLSGRGDSGTVRLDEYREACEVFPILPLLGGNCNNRINPGRTVVDDALLICEESLHLLPEWIRAWIEETGQTIDSERAHVEEAQRVRMDPTLDPAKRRLLAPPAEENVQQRLLASEEAHDADDVVARERTKSTMMPRTFERIASGSLLWWSVTATCFSELELDTFHTILAAFLANPRVGGKKGTGHGLLRAVQARHVQLARPREAPTTFEPDSLAPKMGSQFWAHVAARKEHIAEFLRTVDA